MGDRPGEVDAERGCLDLPVPRAKQVLAGPAWVAEGQLILERPPLGWGGVGEPPGLAAEVILDESIAFRSSLPGLVKASLELIQGVEKDSDSLRGGDDEGVAAHGVKGVFREG